MTVHRRQILDRLRQGRDNLMAKGWGQGYRNVVAPHGKLCCLITALRSAAETDVDLELLDDCQYRLAVAALGEPAAEPLDAVLLADARCRHVHRAIRWNDAFDRTAADIFRAYDEAIAGVEAGIL